MSATAVAIAAKAIPFVFSFFGSKKQKGSSVNQRMYEQQMRQKIRDDARRSTQWTRDAIARGTQQTSFVRPRIPDTKEQSQVHPIDSLYRSVVQNTFGSGNKEEKIAALRRAINHTIEKINDDYDPKDNKIYKTHERAPAEYKTELS